MEQPICFSRRKDYLTEAILSNSQVYYMSLFKMPVAVIDHLDHIRRIFFVGRAK